MSQTFRHPEILELARQAGKVTVEGLARHFGVTVQTVRRDLSDLAETGQLMRVHGGAVLPSGTLNIAHEERRALHADAKAALAQACAKDIEDGASLFLNIGTSTEAVALALQHHEGLMVVTNNLKAASILQANTSARIVLTGGELRRADGGLVGAQAVETVQQFRLDYAVMGCSALSPDGDVLDYDMDEVAVSRALLAAARKPLLVADRSKFQRKAPVRIGGLDQMATIYTDAPLPPAAARLCASGGTEVTICEA